MAGGQGLRFAGQDKGLIVLDQRALVEHVLERLVPQTGQIVISANRNIDRYEAFGYPVISDKLGGYQGPLAGIAAALSQVSTRYIVTAPCDGPLLALDLVDRLVVAMDASEPSIAVAGVGDALEPLYACIDSALAESLNAFLAGGHRKVRHWFAEQPHAVVDFSDQPLAFSNINSAPDLDDFSIW